MSRRGQNFNGELTKTERLNGPARGRGAVAGRGNARSRRPAGSKVSPKTSRVTDLAGRFIAVPEPTETQATEVRPEAVARGRRLVKDPNYPSSAILRSVADLLAEHLR